VWPQNPSRKAGHNSPRLLCAAQLSAPNFNGLRFARRLIHRRIAVCFRVNYGKTQNKFRSFFFLFSSLTRNTNTPPSEWLEWHSICAA
jgi:hypothetical protein